jgi:hypothetical protein
VRAEVSGWVAELWQHDHMVAETDVVTGLRLDGLRLTMTFAPIGVEVKDHGRAPFRARTRFGDGLFGKWAEVWMRDGNVIVVQEVVLDM